MKISLQSVQAAPGDSGCFYSRHLSESIKYHSFPLYLSIRCEQIPFEYLAASVFQMPSLFHI